jgi:excisionase family DNA binding protein
LRDNGICQEASKLMEKNLTVSAAARRLGNSLDAVYRLLYAGKLKARKKGRRWFVSAHAVEDRIQARKK